MIHSMSRLNLTWYTIRYAAYQIDGTHRQAIVVVALRVFFRCEYGFLLAAFACKCGIYVFQCPEGSRYFPHHKDDLAGSESC